MLHFVANKLKAKVLGDGPATFMEASQRAPHSGEPSYDAMSGKLDQRGCHRAHSRHHSRGLRFWPRRSSSCRVPQRTLRR